MTSTIIGRSLGLDLHVHYIDLKPRPLPNRNLRVRFRLQLINSFLNTCSHFRMQVLPSGTTNIDGFPFLRLRVYPLWLPFTHFQDGLSFTASQEPRIVVREARTRTPLQQSHLLLNIQAFAVCNISTYSMCHLGYVVLSF